MFCIFFCRVVFLIFNPLQRPVKNVPLTHIYTQGQKLPYGSSKSVNGWIWFWLVSAQCIAPVNQLLNYAWHLTAHFLTLPEVVWTESQDWKTDFSLFSAWVNCAVDAYRPKQYVIPKPKSIQKALKYSWHSFNQVYKRESMGTIKYLSFDPGCVPLSTKGSVATLAPFLVQTWNTCSQYTNCRALTKCWITEASAWCKKPQGRYVKS